MENLNYTVDSKIIAELLGEQNFSTDESAVLELVKNAYDASARNLSISFVNNCITISDDGVGMNIDDIKNHWMMVGKSDKEYTVKDEYGNERVLAGSKGIGRFALSKLGKNVDIYSAKRNYQHIKWVTDWELSSVDECELDADISHGTIIEISNLRAKWTNKKVERLVDFLSKTYNDDVMTISIFNKDNEKYVVKNAQNNPLFGINCLSSINLKYDSKNETLNVEVISDEFLDKAEEFCNGIDIHFYQSMINVKNEIKSNDLFDFQNEEDITNALIKLGDFSGSFLYRNKPLMKDVDKFLYKHSTLQNFDNSGISLYRNAFSISSYEGKRDWLELGKRARKSPAAASHPTGSWRLRENQLFGKVEIDKNENPYLRDLSNRQGLEENLYYDLFIEIIHLGLKEFERYRQRIIRNINTKNDVVENQGDSKLNLILSNPKAIFDFDKKQMNSFVKEFKNYVNQSKTKTENAENRYKYDVRILNTLSTIGLKASSIAHELGNDRNNLSKFKENIIDALKEYDMWDELNSSECTEISYKNVPLLINENDEIVKKILSFMDTMLTSVEKNQFVEQSLNIGEVLEDICNNWSRDYSMLQINFTDNNHISHSLPVDVLYTIFNNLILNSVQQNSKRNILNISINAYEEDESIYFEYSDDGVGLDKKYKDDTRKILEPHETTRKKGHGLGMWIVYNTICMLGGDVIDIPYGDGFKCKFYVRGLKYGND